MLENGIHFWCLISASRVHADDFVNVPKNLLDKVSAPLGRNDIIIFEVGDPHLLEITVNVGSKSRMEKHTFEILHVPHKVSFCVDCLIDSFLPLFFSVGHTVDQFLWHGIYPRSARFLSE